MTAPDNTPDDSFYPCSYSRGTAFFTGAATGMLVNATLMYAALTTISKDPTVPLTPVWITFVCVIVFCIAVAIYDDRLHKKSIQRGDDQPEQEGEEDDNNTL